MENFMVIINFLATALVFGTPLLYGTTGEILNEKSGSLNLGVEGIMAVGAIGGYLCTATFESLFVGILGGFISSALCGLIYAFLTVTLKANQNVTGLAMTIFGVGLCQFIGPALQRAGKFPLMSVELIKDIKNAGIPGLRDIPVLGELLFNYNSLVYLGIAIAIVAWIYMFKTKSGLRMRATGENPAAADSVGVNISKVRYLNIIIGCGIMGIGGLYRAVISNGGAFNNDWINGYGWISIALVIFAKWSPARAIGGSFVFGLLLALQSRASVLATAYPEIFGWLISVPKQIYLMLPYIITALVIIISSITKKKEGTQPTACGLNYYREDR